MDRQDYTEINSKTWDQWVKDGNEWTIPISHEEYAAAQKGDWAVYLTPSKSVPREWFRPFYHEKSLSGTEILGLASGGGQQMPVFSALGAACTVFDNSDIQLESERMVSERENYPIQIIKGDMTRRLPFEGNRFDMIFHPVSNCYIENVYHVWNECFRILKKGGVLLAGMDNGLNFLFDDDSSLPLVITNKLPYNPLKNTSDEEFKCMADHYDGIQFSHTMEEQIGGQLKAGLTLTDLYEDREKEGCGLLREYAPQFIATRAVKA